jgi:RNA polymerase primary sigma factor
MLESSLQPASLDARIGDENSSERSELIADDRAENPSEVLELNHSVGLLKQLYRFLPERELKILTMRFGLNGDDPLTLSEIGEVMGVTRERIRQLQNVAMAKLRGLIDDVDNNRLALDAA